MPIQRQACFKVKQDSDVPRMIDAYNNVAETNERDGKPYILSVDSHGTLKDERNQGYNFVATLQFKNEDDIQYFDTGCEAHKKLKSSVIHLVAGPPLLLGSMVEG